MSRTGRPWPRGTSRSGSLRWSPRLSRRTRPSRQIGRRQSGARGLRPSHIAAFGQRPNLFGQLQDLPRQVEQLLVLLVLLLDRAPLLVGDHLALRVGAILADHHEGRQEDRLERDDHRQEAVGVDLNSEADPAAEPGDVDVHEQHRAREGGDPVREPVLPRGGTRLFVLQQCRIERRLRLGHRREEPVQPLAERRIHGVGRSRRQLDDAVDAGANRWAPELPVAPFVLWSANAWSTSSGRCRSSNAYTTLIAPMTTAQIPPTVMIAASVAPGLARARMPSGTSARPSRSSIHQSGRTLRAANAPEMLIVPSTISHEPRKIPSTVRLGDGQAMIAIPAATERPPVTRLAMRWSMPTVRIAQTPSKMNSAPMNVERLPTLQSMLKISTPAMTRAMPLTSSVVQLRASRSAASCVSRRPKPANDPGVTNI